MYNFQDCGETKKESLSHDDIDAICAIYPTADDPGTCEHVRGLGARLLQRVDARRRRRVAAGRAHRRSAARASTAKTRARSTPAVSLPHECGVPGVRRCRRAGYVKCPKCQRPLPYGADARSARADPGGTAVDGERLPVLGARSSARVSRARSSCSSALRGGSKPTARRAGRPSRVEAQQRRSAPTTPSRRPRRPSRRRRADPARSGAGPRGGRAELERALRAQRLWSTVDGRRQRAIDVRSGACRRSADARR